ncbi:MAG: iron-sulfur cluster loop [Planctomycetes bacterium]|nr:iron-sulfur cluster loop [Planctomycetota bacterium]
MQRAESKTASKLVEMGKALFDAPAAPVLFTHDKQADALLNDIKCHPHAFVVACLMDRQVKAERAWLVPHRLSERLGGFEFAQLAGLTQEQVYELMTKPTPLHRLGKAVSDPLCAAIRLIRDRYDGDASQIWRERPSSAMVVYRFLEFSGIGPKIATMAANILARDFKIPMTDHYSIDISADVHVRRVFSRLGLVEQGCPVESIIYRARSLHPEFPGLLDLPCWEVGRKWCKPRAPLCRSCPLRHDCPTAHQT